jgi:hypothetical protein
VGLGRDGDHGNASNIGMPDVVNRWVGNDTRGSLDHQASPVFSGTGYIFEVD